MSFVFFVVGDDDRAQNSVGRRRTVWEHRVPFCTWANPCFCHEAWKEEEDRPPCCVERDRERQIRPWRQIPLLVAKYDTRSHVHINPPNPPTTETRTKRSREIRLHQTKAVPSSLFHSFCSFRLQHYVHAVVCLRNKVCDDRLINMVERSITLNRTMDLALGFEVEVEECEKGHQSGKSRKTCSRENHLVLHSTRLYRLFQKTMFEDGR